MKNSETKRVLKQLAQAAKDRLINGGYSSEKTIETKRKLIRENNLRLIATNENKEAQITIKIINIDDEDEKFVKKVQKLLDENSITPFKELVDYKTFNNLSDENKQRYIFNLSDRYNKVKNDYQKLKFAKK